MYQMNDVPSGAAVVPGITHRRSPLSMFETVERLLWTLLSWSLPNQRNDYGRRPDSRPLSLLRLSATVRPTRRRLPVTGSRATSTSTRQSPSAIRPTPPLPRRRRVFREARSLEAPRVTTTVHS
jgi:hypothetical protein